MSVSNSMLAAVVYCVQCSERLCSGCRDAHRRVSATKAHDLQPVHTCHCAARTHTHCAQVSLHTGRTLYCATHPSQIADTVCSCQKLICNTCLSVGEHDQHTQESATVSVPMSAFACVWTDRHSPRIVVGWHR
jgi:hypothetical protein